MTRANQSIPEQGNANVNLQNLVPINLLNSKAQTPAVSSSNQAALKQNKNYSESLNNFRETLKDILEEITSLEVNTIIVRKIMIEKFVAEEFYAELIDNVDRFNKFERYKKLKYQSEEELREAREELLVRNSKLNQREISVSNNPTLLDQYRADTSEYNRDVEAYKEAAQFFSEEVNSEVIEFFRKCQASLERYTLYSDLTKQFSQLEIYKSKKAAQTEDRLLSLMKMQLLTDEKLNAQDIRLLRKMWEQEQSILNGDRIFAQTKFHLDGDLTNRFVEDLFLPSQSKFGNEMPKLVFDLHQRGLENAQKQWGGLITTVVDMIKSLIPFRQDNPNNRSV